ncbi:MAG TPA: hypothetical protein VLV78_14495 [Thermoanaerobaculia bacterium]|nr:hypothetical protein [Thermoanaerobaculia bacterium]
MAQAQFIVAPTPKAGQPFQIRIDGPSPSCPQPTDPQVFIAGKNIFLTFSSSLGCPFPLFSSWVTSVDMPGLAAGTYHLEVRLVGGTVIRYAVADMTVTGPPPGIEISPTFDANAGNRVVSIRGSFPCCTTPAVLFGTKPAEGVERISEGELHAVVPLQTNVTVVDVTVRGDSDTYTLPSGFTYVRDYVPILIPVYTNRPVPGAFGSLWQTELRFLNRSNVSLIPGVDILYAGGDFPPGRVQSPTVTLPRDDVDSPPVALAWIRGELAPFVSVQLRVRDLSRQAETWGTDIPVVFGSRYDLNLLDIPAREGFRSLLRIYSAVYGGCCGVIVKFRTPEGDELATRSLQLQHPNGSIGGLVPAPYKREGSRELPLQPAYAEIDLASIPEIAGHDSVWIQINATMASWALVSVTNDATQHVTIINPR